LGTHGGGIELSLSVNQRACTRRRSLAIRRCLELVETDDEVRTSRFGCGVDASPKTLRAGTGAAHGQLHCTPRPIHHRYPQVVTVCPRGRLLHCVLSWFEFPSTSACAETRRCSQRETTRCEVLGCHPCIYRLLADAEVGGDTLPRDVALARHYDSTRRCFRSTDTTERSMRGNGFIAIAGAQRSRPRRAFGDSDER